MKCIPLNKPHTAAENYYIVNNRIIHFPFYDVWDGKYLMCDMSIQDFDGNIIQNKLLMWIIPDLMTETDRIQASLSHGLIRIIPMSILFHGYHLCSF